MKRETMQFQTVNLFLLVNGETFNIMTTLISIVATCINFRKYPYHTYCSNIHTTTYS